MGWTLERYLKSSVYEWNQAVKGYWRNWERSVAWQAREIIYTMVQISPYIKKEDKPTREQIMKLITDEKKEEVKERVKKPTQKEIDLYEKIQFSLKKENGS